MFFVRLWVYSFLDLRPEAAIALRQRLNETVEVLEKLRKEHAELQVLCETQGKDLTIAKSDCTVFFRGLMFILTITFF